MGHRTNIYSSRHIGTSVPQRHTGASVEPHTTNPGEMFNFTLNMRESWHNEPLSGPGCGWLEHGKGARRIVVLEILTRARRSASAVDICHSRVVLSWRALPRALLHAPICSDRRAEALAERQRKHYGGL